MSLALFIARRIYRGRDADGGQASRPAVLIAILGVSVGLAVMIIAVSVIVGFKSEVRDKIVGFGAHLQVSNLNATTVYESRPVTIDSVLWQMLASDAAVSHVQRYSTKAGMIKTSDAFQGILLKGIGPEYDTRFLQSHLLEGDIPTFSDSVASNKVLLSQSLADKLQLKLGDKIDTYFFQDNIRARRLQIVGIYQTDLTEYDNLFLITDLYAVNRLNQWTGRQSGGLELTLYDYDDLEETTWRIGDELQNRSAGAGEELCVRNIEQLNPAIFAWLGILDINIWVILLLMIGVAGFTMISGLLIIIIERTSMIGVLKSLGADNRTIRHLFLWLSVFLIGKGMFWGDVIGLVFYFVQRYMGIFKLDPSTYYMDTVPVSFNVWLFLLFNAGTLLASVLMLVGPSYFITRIRPADSMRYE